MLNSKNKANQGSNFFYSLTLHSNKMQLICTSFSQIINDTEKNQFPQSIFNIHKLKASK